MMSDQDEQRIAAIGSTLLEMLDGPAGAVVLSLIHLRDEAMHTEREAYSRSIRDRKQIEELTATVAGLEARAVEQTDRICRLQASLLRYEFATFEAGR